MGNLLEFARVDRGQHSIFDVSRETSLTVKLTDHHLARKRVRVATKLSPDISLIQADRQQLRQVLLNLITNTADVVPDAGQLTVRINPEELAADRRNLSQQCRVRDPARNPATGAGRVFHLEGG